MIDRLLDGADALIVRARFLPPGVEEFAACRRECAVIVQLAARLARRLAARRSAFAMRVKKLRRSDFAAAFLVTGFAAGRVADERCQPRQTP